MTDNTQAMALYTAIERAVEHSGGTENLLKAYTSDRSRKAIAFRKHNRNMCKAILHWLRIKIRMEKGLPVYKKGGII